MKKNHDSKTVSDKGRLSVIAILLRWINKLVSRNKTLNIKWFLEKNVERTLNGNM